MRKFVAEVCEGEVEALRKLPCVVDRFRQIAKKGTHLAGAFDVPLAVDAEQPASFVNMFTFFDASEHIVQRLVFRARIADAVRGQLGYEQPEPGGRKFGYELMLLREAVNTLAVLGLCGLNLEPHFLADRARREPAHAVGLMPTFGLCRPVLVTRSVGR